jgi:predicted TIM-barrel fold metal-dependent hydrolase
LPGAEESDAMLITDSQVHLWNAGTPNPWHRQIPAYTANDVLQEMDDAGVDRAVIVPPMWMGDTNDLALEAAQQHPDRLAVLGRLSLGDPASRTLLDDWNSQPGMLGLRFTFSKPEEFTWLTEGSLEWLWAGAERAGIPVMVMISGYLPEVEKIASRHPDLRLCIDHMGLVRNAVDDAAFADLPLLLALAAHPNVVVKTTSLPCYSTAPYPYTALHPYIRQIYDAFGPSRMFWGSDVTRLTSTYRQCVTLITEELDWLSEADKELIMGRAIGDWLGWNAAP